MKQKWILLGYGLVSLLFLLLIGFYLWQKDRIEKRGFLAKPVFPKGQEREAGVNKRWSLADFQPLVKEFVSDQGLNYLLVEYPKDNREMVMAYVLVSGKIGNREIVKIEFEGEFLKSQPSFEELKTMIAKGQQIRVEYIKKIPENFEDDIWCDSKPGVCWAAELMKNKAELPVEQVIGDGEIDFEEKVVPGILISAKLLDDK